MSLTFDNSNSDLKIRSSDGVVFDLHRALLAAHTGAFPGTEIDTSGEDVVLTEPANVLRICFDFVYPKRHPDLEDINDFDLIAAVAEAVGKYEIFSAMYPCNTRLRAFLPSYAAQIYIYALKHDHPKLLNDAAPFISRSSFTSVLRQLPPSYAYAWFEYHNAWSAVFRGMFKYIGDLPVYMHDSRRGYSQSSCHIGRVCAAEFESPEDDIEACYMCKVSMFKFISKLEEIDTMSGLKDALKTACDEGMELPCCDENLANNRWSNCSHIIKLARKCQSLVQEIPPFETFVANSSQAS